MQTWPTEALWEALEPAWPGLSLEVAAELDSTNSVLLERARAGDDRPAVLVAEHQRAGRGRMGRSWSAAPGEALCFSVAVPLAPEDWSGLSLAVGVALAQAMHERVRLKWPNDLWCVDEAGVAGKLGGILIETATLAGAVPARRLAVIGVGLNVGAVPSGSFEVPARPYRELEPQATAPELLARLVPALLTAVRQFEQAGLTPFRAGFARRDALFGAAVRVKDAHGGVALEGRAGGIADDGSLIVESANGRRHNVSSAEVSVRPC